VSIFNLIRLFPSRISQGTKSISTFSTLVATLAPGLLIAHVKNVRRKKNFNGTQSTTIMNIN